MYIHIESLILVNVYFFIIPQKRKICISHLAKEKGTKK